MFRIQGTQTPETEATRIFPKITIQIVTGSIGFSNQ